MLRIDYNYFRLMATTKSNSLLEQNPLFSDHISKFTMKFLNSNYEKEFLETKFEKKNFLVAIGISIYFSMIIFGLRFIQGNLKNNYEMVTTSSTDPNLISAYIWNLPLVIEGIIYFIPRLTLLRGFFFNTFPMYAIIYSSHSLCINHKTIIPLVVPISIMYAMMAIVICFIYAANWICGAIQIIILL